ncbi:unnamed protein product, partial [Heterosigma akashiwo]
VPGLEPHGARNVHGQSTDQTQGGHVQGADRGHRGAPQARQLQLHRHGGSDSVAPVRAA